MKSRDLGRYAMTCATVALLVGCGGNAGSGTIPIAAHADRGRSWMLPEAKSDELLYYSDGAETVYVLSYPQGKLVGTLQGFDGAEGVCSDSAGDVFITALETQNVTEYAHGGTEPIATLGDYGYYPSGCAIDPVSGDLAVANVFAFNASAGTVAVYNGAKGKPTDYMAPGFKFYQWCAYDGSGNLFVDGDAGLTEMPYGTQSFTNIALSVYGAGLQWDGQYLAMVASSSNAVYRIAVSGSSGTVVQTVSFKGLFSSVGDDFVFQGAKIVMPYATQRDVNRIGLWRYPKGGNLQSKVHRVDGLQAIALSY